MADQWYYRRNGESCGPMSSEVLKQMALSGQLKPTDLVWKDGMSNWMPAKDIKGLFVLGGTGSSTPPPFDKSAHVEPSHEASTGSPPFPAEDFLKRAKERYTSSESQARAKPQVFLRGVARFAYAFGWLSTIPTCLQLLQIVLIAFGGRESRTMQAGMEIGVSFFDVILLIALLGTTVGLFFVSSCNYGLAVIVEYCDRNAK